MMYSFSKQKAGFSLVETLVAITILLIVITGPMSIVANATQGTTVSSERLVANFLAQEGAELAQMARDNILLPRFDGVSSDAWTEFTTGGTYSDCFSGGCGLEILTNANGSLDVIDCRNPAVALTACQLHVRSAGERSLYTHDSAGTSPSVFRREVEMTIAAAGNEVRVVSRVTWRPVGQQRLQSAEVVTYLYDVYDR